ncbi:MAG: bifunctional phosphoribosylaminoimidazolecarboxamide formyltransferase/IMP cyclohydrolase [Paracoccaceae bacterium]
MKKNMVKIRKALISVSNKSGLKKFVEDLVLLGIKIIASGGTADYIKDNGFNVIDIEAITGFPELLGGRVKTLHPKIHSAILADRENENHIKDLKSFEIDTVDLVVCDLYPFSKSVHENMNHDYCVDNIDIGGITLLRGAAKNFKYVTVVSDYTQYEEVISHLSENDGFSTYDFRLQNAYKAFNYSSNYDLQISKWFSKINKSDFHDLIIENNKLIEVLSYGENSHQKAAFYQDELSRRNWGSLKKIQGKGLSYNNHLDLDASLNLLYNFKNYKEAIVGIIKHTNPCGVSSGETLFEAYNNAMSCDPLSAFGGIVVFNKKVNRKVANELVNNFFEMIVAPDYDKEALEIFSQKKNLRIINIDNKWKLNKLNKKEFRSVIHGILTQEVDTKFINKENLKVVTKLSPTKKEIKDLIFAWNVVKIVKSNGIVIVQNMKTIGIGSGQPSRIDSSKIAISKALKVINSENKNQKNLKNAVMASDAFFPFSDGIEEAIENGINAIVQPGGSIRDDQVIKVANEKKISMVFTGIRSFKH